MARLQILQLPEGAGDERPPFILVIDQVGDAETERLIESQEATNGIAKKVGARAVAVFHGMTVDIPANDPAAYVERSEPSGEHDRARQAEAKMKAAFDVAASFEAQRDEARQWARHGYEIGQRHCGWTDHGVAPAWLTEGWPPHIDSCEHLKQMAEFDEALTRVRQLHRPVEHGGITICAECSGWDGSTCDNSPCVYEHCPTLKAIAGDGG